jgi:hypothetical protein
VELDENGAKKTSFIYANGMKVASVFLSAYPSPHWVTHWHHTNPVTGDSFKTGQASEYFGGQNLDPLGADVSTPPDPMTFEEPSWLDPRKDFFWPVEYEANWTGEAERGMAEYASRVNADYDRRRAEYFWSTGRRDLAMEIVARNPNVGLEVRSYRVGFTITFNIFGSNAANYLLGLSNRIDNGDLVAATPAQASARLHSMREDAVKTASSKGSGGATFIKTFFNGKKPTRNQCNGIRTLVGREAAWYSVLSIGGFSSAILNQRGATFLASLQSSITFGTQPIGSLNNYWGNIPNFPYVGTELDVDWLMDLNLAEIVTIYPRVGTLVGYLFGKSANTILKKIRGLKTENPLPLQDPGERWALVYVTLPYSTIFSEDWMKNNCPKE